MSAAADWPHDEANNVALPTIVSSTDLFDGDLFGDELMDIYNSTIEAAAQNQGMLLLLRIASLFLNSALTCLDLA